MQGRFEFELLIITTSIDRFRPAPSLLSYHFSPLQPSRPLLPLLLLPTFTFLDHSTAPYRAPDARFHFPYCRIPVFAALRLRGLGGSHLVDSGLLVGGAGGLKGGGDVGAEGFLCWFGGY